MQLQLVVHQQSLIWRNTMSRNAISYPPFNGGVITNPITAPSVVTSIIDSGVDTSISLKIGGSGQAFLNVNGLSPSTNLTKLLGTGTGYWSQVFARTVNFNSTASIDGTTAGQIKATGLIMPVQAPTASQPTYVKGGIYFDTTLNKLMVGGATTWETVTSV